MITVSPSFLVKILTVIGFILIAEALYKQGFFIGSVFLATCAAGLTLMDWKIK